MSEQSLGEVVALHAPPAATDPHQKVIRSVLNAWEDLAEHQRAQLDREVPEDLMRPLRRLVDPRGLRGHCDAKALSAAYRQLTHQAIEDLSRAMPFHLFWAVARLSQNLG